MKPFVTTRGQGQAVLLLHSGGMSQRQWKKLGDELSSTHRVVAADFLGAGQSGAWPTDRPFSFELDVDALADLLTEQGEPVHLVGHSYGGFIATCLARRMPAQVRSLGAYDPVSFGILYDARDEVGLRDLARASEHPAFSDVEHAGDARWFELFVDFWNGEGAWQKLAQPARESFLAVGHKVFFEVYSLMQDRTPASAYAPIQAPALFLTGELSPPAAQRVVAQLAVALPHARYESIDGAGHMGPITHAADVNARLAAHVRAASA